MLRRTIILGVGVLLLLPALAVAEDWTRSFEVGDGAELTVKTSDASIRVEAWSRDVIEARVTTRKSTLEEMGVTVEAQQSGDSVEMEVRFPRWPSYRNFHHVRIELRVPERLAMDLHTGDGDIEIRGVGGELQVYSGDGDIRIEDADGNLTASSGDGDIVAAGRFDGLNISTGDGDVDTSATGGSQMLSEWRISTGDGRVTLGLPSDFSADLDLRTNDGRIKVDIPFTFSGQVASRKVRGTINGGGETLTLRTGDGSILVEPSSM